MSANLQERLGHCFAKPELLDRALTHSSDAESRGEGLLSNERLEFVGDRVLGLCIAEWLAERFTAEREGDLAKRLSMLVSADTLCKVAEDLGLGADLRMPARYRATGLMGPRNLLSDAFEAVLGAIYLDGGMAPARALVRRCFAGLIEADARPPTSPKNRLQEWTLGRGLGLPVYGLVQAIGPAHAPRFIARVLAAGREAQGEGDSKRAAEQAAAAAWLKELNT
jgi:ribonuclease-3